MISYDTLRAVLTMSITGSVLAIILFALKPIVRDRLPKSTQYYLWLVVLAALVVPISRLVVLPDSASNVPTISKTVDWFVVTNEDIFERIKPYETENADGFIGIPESSMAEVEALIPDTWVPEAVDWFRFVHYLGVIVYLAFIYCSYAVFTSKIKRRNTTAVTEEHAMLAELCGGKLTPRLYRNPLAATPMMIGVFHPAIILPDREYTDKQLRAVLLHELTHLRRKDVSVKWLSVLVTALHWFNPIVWLVRREIDRACELSCDEAVIRNLDTDGKQNYGETLLYVAADSKTPHAVLSTTMCEEKKALKERLSAIMKSKKHTRLAIIVSAVLLVVVGGIAIALGAGRATIYKDNQLIIINESTAQIASIGVYYNNETLVASNADNSPIKKGERVNFQFDIAKGQVFQVSVSDVNWNLVTQGEFARYFDDTGLVLYIRDDENGNTHIVDESLREFASLRTPYVGNNSAVGNIVNILPTLGEQFTQKFFSIGDDYGTGKSPNTLTLYYEQNGETGDDFTITSQIPLILFAMIDNLEEVNIATRNSPSGSKLDKSAYGIRYTYPRPEATDYLPDVGITWGDFQNDWENSFGKLYAQALMNNVHEWDSARNLTLDDVRALAAKGDTLQYSDFPSRGLIGLSSIASGYNPTLYGVEGGYRLLINFNDTLNPESGIKSTALESIWESGGSGIDIRYNDVDEFIRTHPSHPADTVPPTSYTPREWINRQNLDYSLTTTVDLMIDEFPDVLFSYTPEKLTATSKNGVKELFGGTDGFIFGGYIDILFLADLNGDGLPEFCGTTNHGSGFGDSRVIVYDYANDKRYVISDRGSYDYFLQMENGQLEVIQTVPMQMSNMPRGVGSLAIINGEIVIFGIDRTIPETAPEETTPPGEYLSQTEIVDESVIKITDFEIGNDCYLNVEVFINTGEVYSASGAAIYEVVGYAALVLSADVIVDYIDYESPTNRNVKKLISYLSQGGSYNPDPTIAMLIVRTDDGENIIELTEIYVP